MNKMGELVDYVIRGMYSNYFPTVPASYCNLCPIADICPASGTDSAVDSILKIKEYVLEKK